MSKKKNTPVDVVANCDLDVGGICKNVKTGDVLKNRVVSALKRATLDPKGKRSWYDFLISSGAIKETEQTEPEKPAENPAAPE